MSALAKLTAAHAPVAGGAGKRGVEDAAGFALEAVEEAEFGGVAAEDVLGGFIEGDLGGLVGEAELAVGVEGEDRDVDFLHYGAEEGSGCKGVEALLLERAAEDVNSHITSPSGSSRRAPRARTAKSLSRIAERRLAIVCSGRATRPRSAAAKPNQQPTMRSVSFH